MDANRGISTAKNPQRIISMIFCFSLFRDFYTEEYWHHPFLWLCVNTSQNDRM